MTTKVETPTATEDELITMASVIWKKVKNSKIDVSDEVGRKKLMKEIDEEYNNFCTSFTMVVKYMVFLDQYSKKAFTQFLTIYAKTKIDSREKFLELQTTYLYLLFKELNPHSDELRLRNYKAWVLEQLLSEDKKYAKFAEEETVALKGETRQKMIDQIRSRISTA